MRSPTATIAAAGATRAAATGRRRSAARSSDSIIVPASGSPLEDLVPPFLQRGVVLGDVLVVRREQLGLLLLREGDPLGHGVGQLGVVDRRVIAHGLAESDLGG